MAQSVVCDLPLSDFILAGFVEHLVIVLGQLIKLMNVDLQPLSPQVRSLKQPHKRPLLYP